MTSDLPTSKLKSAKLIIFLVVLVDLIGFGVFIPMLPFYSRHFGASAFQTGLLMFVYSGMQMLVSPIWGQVSDRIGRRPVLLLTILGQGLAFLWSGFSPTYLTLLLSRVFAGLFSANISTASAYIADITEPKDRAKGMGLIGAAFGIGFIIGPAVGGLLIPYGYSWPSFASAILCLFNLAWASFALPEPFVRSQDREGRRRKLSIETYREVTKDFRLFSPTLIFFFSTLAFTQLEITFGFFAVDRFHLIEKNVGFLFAGMGLISAFVQGGAIGRIVKKLGEVKTVEMGLPLIVIGLLGLVVSHFLWMVMICLALIALGYSFVNPCLSAIVSKATSSEKQGSVLGIYQSAGSFARVLGPILAGLLYDRSAVGAFVGAVVIIVFAKGVFSFYRQRLRLETLSRENN